MRLSRLFVALLAIGALVLGTQRTLLLTQDAHSCCASWRWAAPSLGMLFLALAPERADARRWERDFVLALEKRRAKRLARLATGASPCNLSMYRLVSHRNVQNSCQK